MMRFYRAFGILVVLFYAATLARGWEIGTPTRGVVIPASVRQAPGGYRNYIFWRGGK